MSYIAEQNMGTCFRFLGRFCEGKQVVRSHGVLRPAWPRFASALVALA